MIINIKKVQDVIGFARALKFLQFSRRRYWQLKQKARCAKSVLNFCITKHPAQLLRQEVNAIKKYCEDIQYIHWPLASVYHQIMRDSAARFHISTFYKYAALLQLKRLLPKHRRKNHRLGIRAAVPLQLLHADVTIFRTADNIKAYIFLVQDNFSRMILGYKVALECNAGLMADLIKDVYSRYLRPAQISHCRLMTDDGNENYGQVQGFLLSTHDPELQHIVAQKDIEFSNSMIEAANKNLKYRFLYLKHIPDLNSLCQYLSQAIDDYNNRPYNILAGLTPLEAMNGRAIDKKGLHVEMLQAKGARIAENRRQKCCNYSF